MLPELITEIPGPRSRALAETLRRYESRNVTYLADDWPIFWERAEGTNVWDADGNRFLDLTSAFGVAGLGHTAPVIRSALEQQAGRLLHAMGDVHPTEVKAQVCAQLSALTFERWGAGEGKVILGNSGFEAIEAALKTAYLHTKKPGVIAFRGGYHGLGFGALTVTGLPYFREPFRAQLKEFVEFIDFPYGEGADLALTRAALEAAVQKGDIGAVLVEPIQGRGGCVVPPADFLPLLREFCDARGLLLVLDEIYTGFNRTGNLFACEASGVVPDLICVGKALTTAFPLSACVGSAAIMDAWPESTGEAIHTSTFLGNPLGCAMALAAMAEHAKPETAEQVRAKGDAFTRALQKLGVGKVRGRGLMLGLELLTPDGAPHTDLAIRTMKQALREGLLLLADSPTSHILSFSPPFTISDVEIAFVADRLQSWLV